MKSLPKAKNIIYVVLAIIITVLVIVIALLVIEQRDNDDNKVISSKEDGLNSTNAGVTDDSNSAMHKEIEEATNKSAYNKSQYKSQYLYYMGLKRYTGTQAAYNAKVNQYAKDIGQAYADYSNKVSAISSSLGSGYRQYLENQYAKERDNKIAQISAEMSELKEAWENQQNYLRYYSLYSNEDEKLAQEIERIKAKYN